MMWSILSYTIVSYGLYRGDEGWQQISRVFMDFFRSEASADFGEAAENSAKLCMRAKENWTRCSDSRRHLLFMCWTSRIDLQLLPYLYTEYRTTMPTV